MQKAFIIIILLFLTVNSTTYSTVRYYNHLNCKGDYYKEEKKPCSTLMEGNEIIFIICNQNENKNTLIYNNGTIKGNTLGCINNDIDSIKIIISGRDINSEEIIIVVLILFICVISAYSFAFRTKSLTGGEVASTKDEVIQEMIQDIASYVHIFRNDNYRGKKSNKKDIIV